MPIFSLLFASPKSPPSLDFSLKDLSSWIQCVSASKLDRVVGKKDRGRSTKATRFLEPRRRSISFVPAVSEYNEDEDVAVFFRKGEEEQEREEGNQIPRRDDGRLVAVLEEEFLSREREASVSKRRDEERSNNERTYGSERISWLREERRTKEQQSEFRSSSRPETVLFVQDS